MVTKIAIYSEFAIFVTYTLKTTPMQYLRRAVKYFFYFLSIIIIIMAVLVALGMVEPNVETMFKNGYDSLWQIAIMLMLFAVAYPFFGFMTKEAIVPGSYGEIRDGVVSFMEDHGYRLEKEEGENLSFRLKSKVNRASRMCEDRITMTRSFTGFSVEGLRKDVVRLCYGLENKFLQDNTQL